MCVVNKQLGLLEFVFYSVYIDMQYDDISFSLTVGSVSMCCICNHVVVFGLSVRVLMVPYVDAVVGVTVMRVLLSVLHVCMLRECDAANVTAMMVWAMEEVWLW